MHNTKYAIDITDEYEHDIYDMFNMNTNMMNVRPVTTLLTIISCYYSLYHCI